MGGYSGYTCLLWDVVTRSDDHFGKQQRSHRELQLQSYQLRLVTGQNSHCWNKLPTR